jgi:hypothetical protein
MNDDSGFKSWSVGSNPSGPGKAAQNNTPRPKISAPLPSSEPESTAQNKALRLKISTPLPSSEPENTAQNKALRLKISAPPPSSEPENTAQNKALRLKINVPPPVPEPRVKKTEPPPEPTYMPGYIPCFKCGEQGREDRMFHDNNRHICPSCYNPYLHKVTSAFFYRLLPGAFAFPFRGNNVIMLVVGSMFFGVLTFFASLSSSSFMTGGAIGMAGGSFLAEYLMSIISSSAVGSDDLPDWPDFGVGRVAIAGIQFATAWIAPILPAALYYFFFVRTGFGSFSDDLLLMAAAPTDNGVVFLALLICGLFLIPAATASVTMSSSFIEALTRISPHLLFPAIVRALPEYLLASVVLVLTMLANSTVQLVWIIIGGSWLGSLLTVPFTLYFLMVEMRLLGLFWRLSSRRLHNEENWKLLEAGKLPYRKKTVEVARNFQTEQ